MKIIVTTNEISLVKKDSKYDALLSPDGSGKIVLWVDYADDYGPNYYCVTLDKHQYVVVEEKEIHEDAEHSDFPKYEIGYKTEADNGNVVVATIADIFGGQLKSLNVEFK